MNRKKIIIKKKKSGGIKEREKKKEKKKGKMKITQYLHTASHRINMFHCTYI